MAATTDLGHCQGLSSQHPLSQAGRHTNGEDFSTSPLGTQPNAPMAQSATARPEPTLKTNGNWSESRPHSHQVEGTHQKDHTARKATTQEPLTSVPPTKLSMPKEQQQLQRIPTPSR
ncbi:hypothetical protein LX36DRAFT_664640 [Colletotrichum falcatum]|nr:hypothetical protein LX36DRAFT_664640 [Colletotrichum falcatum]